jgi:hypothetical protein
MTSIVRVNFSKNVSVFECYEQKRQEQSKLEFLPSQIESLKRLYNHPLYRNAFNHYETLNSNDISRIVIHGQVGENKIKIVVAKTLSSGCTLPELIEDSKPLRAFYYCNFHTESIGKAYINNRSKPLVVGSTSFIDIPCKIREAVNQLILKNKQQKNNIYRINFN